MIAVVFEVWPDPAAGETYLEIAASLASGLTDIDGFLSVERFQSLTNARKLLSLSFWRDEQAVAAWRNTIAHRDAQSAGRRAVLSDYRLRVAAVLRDYGMQSRAEAPADSRAIHG